LLQTWHPPTLASAAVLPKSSRAGDEHYSFVIFIVLRRTLQQHRASVSRKQQLEAHEND